MNERVPIIYFHSIEPGSYVAAYPVFVVEDRPDLLQFSMQVDDLYAAQVEPWGSESIAEDASEPRRAYVTATFRRRLHQVAFRQRVIRAYAERCALCRLRQHGAPRRGAHHTGQRCRGRADRQQWRRTLQAASRRLRSIFLRDSARLRHRGAALHPPGIRRPYARCGAPADPRAADPPAKARGRPARPSAT